MKINKKLLAVILAGMMSASVFVGCSSTNNSESTNTETTIESNSSNVEAEITSVTSDVTKGTIEAFYSIPENLQAFKAGMEEVAHTASDIKDMDVEFEGNTIIYSYEFLEPKELTEEDESNMEAELESVIDSVKAAVEADTGVPANDVTIIYQYCNPGWELVCSFEF